MCPVVVQLVHLSVSIHDSVIESQSETHQSYLKNILEGTSPFFEPKKRNAFTTIDAKYRACNFRVSFIHFGHGFHSCNMSRMLREVVHTCVKAPEDVYWLARKSAQLVLEFG